MSFIPTEKIHLSKKQVLPKNTNEKIIIKLVYPLILIQTIHLHLKRFQMTIMHIILQIYK